MRPFLKMEDKQPQENINKTPSKMARLAWPKAKYGAIIADRKSVVRERV